MKFLLLPFAFLYGAAIRIRNFLFDTGLLKSISFNTPIIVVGNLTTGGTGKTPCVEYLIRLIKDDYKTVVLSRGYKRKSKGFLIGSKDKSARDIGDEPLQLTSKFPDITVAVDRQRVNGVRNLLRMSTPPEAIILDDGFQHRKLKPGLSIILTEYNNIFCDDSLIPAGNLREHKYNSKRADIIIITKSPEVHSPIGEKLIIKKLNPGKNQLMFFSYLEFGEPIAADPISCQSWDKTNPNTIILFTGIANPAPLEQYLQTLCSSLITIKYPDHHSFSKKNIETILKTYNDQYSRRKIVLTTEKDFFRLRNEQAFQAFNDIPLYYIPVFMNFHPHSKGIQFDEVIIDYLRGKKYISPLANKKASIPAGLN